jgi:ribonuclease E
LQRLVKRGQELLVQVAKDPIMNKGAMLTTLLSLPGRHVVLMPGHSVKGVSRKIEDESERLRLKGVVGELEIPEGYGVIVRTAGLGCSKTMISKDVKDLMRLWKTIRQGDAGNRHS